MSKKRRTKEEGEPRRRGRPSKSKYDDLFKVDATPEEVGRAIVTTSPKQLKEWQRRKGGS